MNKTNPPLPFCKDSINSSYFSLIEKNDHSSVYYDYKTGNKVNALWSLGVPALFSPIPSYLKIFEENNLNFEDWSIPSDYERYDCKIRDAQSLGRAIAEKMHKIVTDKEFKEKRKSLFDISLRYNPMNIFWIYESMFKSL